ncbi:MAG: FAD:protein FMN transferase [Oscillospiraceae bacterium]|nr:FAD:protein FMN transferase [Oscillospiraceae bacterium]
MKRFLSIILISIFCLMPLSGCGIPKYTKYRGQFYGTFDTVVELVGYVAKEKDFDRYLAHAKERFQYYNQLFDKYNTYEGVANIKTINDNAGIAPVTVNEDLLDFLEFCMEWEQKTDGTVNIALGPVLSIWHDYREMYQGSDDGEIPSMEALQEADRYTDVGLLEIDRERSTVYLPLKEMSLDVGCCAKGYATEKVGNELYEMGFTSFSISGGGNVRTYDAPLDGVREKWGISIGNPFMEEDPAAQPLDILFVRNCSVVTSGDYQRYYMADGKRYHHIIDPKTLMPASAYRSVTVVAEDSGVADLLSTALFIADLETGRAMAERLGAQAVWVLPDGSMEITESLIPQMKELGGATAAISQ